MVPIWPVKRKGKVHYRGILSKDPVKLELRMVKESERDVMLLEAITKHSEALNRGMVLVYWNRDKDRPEGYFNYLKKKIKVGKYYKRWKGVDVWKF